jgi:N-methylhydantoinase A
VVRVAGGEILIGPDRLGPAMAYGGPAPTPTDALFVLGRAVDGNIEASRQGLQPVADQLGIPLEEAANRVFDDACGIILAAAGKMIAAINSKTVYTVRELLSGYKVQPREILVLGGPAPLFAFRLAQLTDMQVTVVPQWGVANAIGAALAKGTSEVTLFADTERGIAVAPEEDFAVQVKKDFTRQSAIDLAFDLLRKKCGKAGASNESELEMEVIEDLQFNMIRDFYTAGKNIRVKVQVRPGLLPEYREVARNMVN